MRIWFVLFTALGIAALFAWAWDWVTPQGERTVYTADCRGQWKGRSCEGELLAGKRHRFRVLSAHREVLYWTVGSRAEPSGKFSDCTIENGRNWVCKPAAGQPPAITLAMVRGEPAPLPGAAPYVQVSKPYWWWLDLTKGRGPGA